MQLRNQRGFFITEKVNNAVRTELELTVREAETFYRAQISRLVSKARHKRVILISGPSSSGKTTTAQRILHTFQSRGIPAVPVSLDDFYKNREDLPVIDGRPNAEVIQALELDLITQTLLKLDTDGCAMLPEFDFIHGMRLDNVKKVSVPDNGVILVEGLHALNDLIYSRLPAQDLFRVYVSPHSGFTDNGSVLLTKRQVRFIRRLVRDFRTRGCDGEQTFARWADVCRGEDVFIRPFRKYADFRVNTTYSYECGLLRNQALSILSDIPPDSIYYTQAMQLCRSLQTFYPVPDTFVPEDSLLHEFYG